jgi:hypothetical protein
MARTQFTDGHADIEDFFYWVNERHRIWWKRFVMGHDAPWTEDEYLKFYKFTNVFRELDKGTLALRNMIWAGVGREGDRPAGVLAAEALGFKDWGWIAVNIMWYRMFNWYMHAGNPGFVTEFERLKRAIWGKELASEKVFTGCHMTVGKAGEPKIITNLRSIEVIFEKRDEIREICESSWSLETVWQYLRQFECIGPFISYEIVSDFRWYGGLLGNAHDILKWANLGPGCKRGLRRLGLPLHVASLKFLWEQRSAHLDPALFSRDFPPFELREIEHSLCEFDKYERAKSGAGRPREKFRKGGGRR